MRRLHRPRERNYSAAKVRRAIDKHGRAAWAGVACVAIACGVVVACGSSKQYDDVYVHATGGAGAGSGATSTATAGEDSGSAALGGAGGVGGDAGSADAGAGGALGVDGDVLYIKASNPDANDWFGGALALSGDWLAIGAKNESSLAVGIDGDETDDSEDNSGAVYLFLHEASGWAQRAYVKASSSDASDGFGSVLSFSGHTLAVGAPYEDGAASGVNGEEGNGKGKGGNQGAAYVFVEQDGKWQQQAYVKATNTDAVDLFGTDVALSGDVLVVGAPWEDSAATQVDGDQKSNAASASGAVYVYERSGEQWQPISYLKASNGEADDELGQAVAVSGDIIAVGAPGESSGDAAKPTDNSASRSGAVYVFQHAGVSYEQVAYLKASNADAGDAFGSHLALASDTLVVGATREGTLGGDGEKSNELRPNSGAAYVFERRSGDWVQTAYLKAPIPAEDAYFGNALALEGDTLVVGALGDDSEQLPLSGTAYVYGRTALGWQLRTTMKAPNAEIGDRYGSSVAISPTLLAVGADNEAANVPGINGDWTNNDAPGAGAAYLYRR